MARKGGKAGAYYAKQLHGPETPRALAYLREWLYQLVGRSGVGMSGANPLSYGTIADWSRLTGNRPTPDEVEALLYLDAVLRGEQRDAAEKAKPIPSRADVPKVEQLPARDRKRRR